mmetsp:Transcript_35783/g.82887  ORF Transcript_35783/g.82887 Transcript_35783/m.82887 type:complete len:226 (+) Transcript_35783:172-849(+)
MRTRLRVRAWYAKYSRSRELRNASHAEADQSCSRRALLERLEQPKKPRRLADMAELDAEGLHLDQQVAYVDDLIADERLQEDAHEPHQPVLHVLVLDAFARGDAVGDVQVHELSRQVHRSCQAIDHLHGVKADVHVDEHGEIVGDLTRAHQLEQHLDRNNRVVLHQVGKSLGRESAVVDELRVRLKFGEHLLLLLRHQRALEGLAHEFAHLRALHVVSAHGVVPQ